MKRLRVRLSGFSPEIKADDVEDMKVYTAGYPAEFGRQLGGVIAGLGFAVELDFLKGRAKFAEYDVFSLLHYDE